jgi:hypothetical protein
MMLRFRSDDPWRLLWQLTTSDYLLGGALLTLALALLLVAWLPQTSAGESALDVTWQAEVHRRFGQVAWFDALRLPLQALGAFHVADAIWFRLLLALLALLLLARLVDSADGLWRGWRGNAPPEGTPWEAVDDTLEELVTRLRARRLRVVLEASQGDAGTDNVQAGVSRLVCASRWPWGELGPVLVYLGGLVTLLGAAITAMWGWQTGSLPLTAGESIALGHGSGLTLQLDTLTDDGRLGVGQIWREGDAVVGGGDLAVGRPLSAGGVGTYLVGRGAGLRVQATQAETQALVELAMGPDQAGQEELVLTFTDDEPRYLGMPAAGLVLRLTMPQPAQVGALPAVQAFESGTGQLILARDAPADTPLALGDISLALTPIPFAEIRAVHDPGAFWVQCGVIGLIAGMVLWGLWPPRRLWLRGQAGTVEPPGEVEVAGDVEWFAALKPLQPDDDEA